MNCRGRRGAPIIVVNSPRAIARVIHERSELGFGRAWVAGELDVEGDLGETLELDRSASAGITLDRRDLLAALQAARRLNALPLREPEPPQSEVRLRGRLHSLRRDKQAIQHHYDVSNRFYRARARPDDGLLVRVLRRPRTSRSTPRRPASSTSSAAS